MSQVSADYNWEKLLADAAMLQARIPSAILVGGTAKGESIRVPTVEEMLRIKCFLLVERNATRDYLDVAALSYHIGLSGSARALEEMNRLYSDFAGEGGDLLLSIVLKLTNPDPYDLTDVDLSEYKGIIAPWNAWNEVEKQCRGLALELLNPRPDR